MHSKIWFYLTIAITCLSLSGIVDGFIAWRDWFEVGVMEHWRLIRSWLFENLLFWFPWNIPHWTLDYFIIGGIYARASLSVMNNKMLSLSVMEVVPTETQGAVKKAILAYTFLLGFVFWPILIFKDCLNIRKAKANPNDPENWQVPVEGFEYESFLLMRIAIMKKVFLSFLIFIPILFVATDFIGTFNS